MKTILELNSINYSSTGNIAINIAKTARLEGFEVYTACKKSRVGKRFNPDNQIFVGTWIDRVISEQLAYYTGYKDSFNIINTWLFLRKINKIKPDLIHIHSLTDTYINLEMLFKYINRNNIPVVYTFHDVWSMTGQCIYFDYIKCNKWIDGCNNCPQLHREPASWKFDRSEYLWKKKKRIFTSVNNLTVVTPSIWLANLAKESFFNKYPIKVINNGINLDIFKPIQSDFRKRYNIEDKFIILGVAAKWAPRKGLDVFVKLASDLSNDYKVVLVGTNDEIDKTLPNNIISIHKTFNQQELAEIYTASDLFAIPTREDNFPTVNLEALACGTPVITFKTGGSAEMIDDKCGIVINVDDYNSFKKAIIEIKEIKPFDSKYCVEHAKVYNMNSKFKEYVELFKSVLDN